MKLKDIIIIPVFFLLVFALKTSGFAGNIESGKRMAWGENIGWINFAPVGKEGVTITDNKVSGFAWSENTGWINLSPENSTALRGVKNDGNGNLSGFAWAENSGWIKFNEVFIDPCTGVFGGKAWGENTGWINFDISDLSKKVVTTWRKDRDGDNTPDCNDNCPDDPLKTEPGSCGCGVEDTDTDGDNTPDCNDRCPDDSLKTDPGLCGCGVADTDTDGNGIPDCNESQAPEKKSSGGGGSCFILSAEGY